MRVDTKKIIQLMNEHDAMTPNEFSIKSCIPREQLDFIMDCGFASEESIYRIANALDTDIKSIAIVETASCENGIEFIKDDPRATVLFSQRRYINRVKQLAKKFPDDCEILAENRDGSICAHVPTAWVKINPPKQISEETKEKLSAALTVARQAQLNQAE